MSEQGFRFKQFAIQQERCAMKVGTDGVLLGAWAALPAEGNILDIGTGTGILALMAAQRTTECRITAIEIDADAAEQAKENVAASPWHDRIEVLHADFNEFARDTERRFAAILSNPPYFEESLRPNDGARCTARHTVTLQYDALFSLARRLLLPEGRLSLVIPADLYKRVDECAMLSGWSATRLTYVCTTPRKSPKRVLCEWQQGIAAPCPTERLVIAHSPNCYTDAYRELTRDFYLHF